MILVGVDEMIELRVTEKFKDQVLNVALVGSLFLFVFGVNKPENIKVAQPQEGVGLVATRLAPLDQPSFAILEQLQPVTTQPEPGQVTANQAPSIRTVSARAPNPEANSPLTGTVTDPSSSGLRDGSSQRTPVSETLNSILSGTKLHLF